MKCYLTIFEEFTWAHRMADQCNELGLDVVLVINGRTWPPLDKWLHECPYEQIEMGSNTGVNGFLNGPAQTLKKRFITSDSDLDLSGVPGDVVIRLSDALDLNKDVRKAGLSLQYDDVPESYVLHEKVVAYEKGTRITERPGDCYHAGIGATFAMYEPKRSDLNFYSAVRLKEPYTARHEPWYLDIENLSEEHERYYLKCSSGYYATKMRELIRARSKSS